MVILVIKSVNLKLHWKNDKLIIIELATDQPLLDCYLFVGSQIFLIKSRIIIWILNMLSTLKFIGLVYNLRYSF